MLTNLAASRCCKGGTFPSLFQLTTGINSGCLHFQSHQSLTPGSLTAWLRTTPDLRRGGFGSGYLLSHWPNHPGSNLQSTRALLSTAEPAASKQSYKLCTEPKDPHPAPATASTGRTISSNYLQGVKPGIQNEEHGPI